MNNLERDFEKAIEDIKKIFGELKQNDVLQLYGLYKQSNFGKNTTPRPSIFNVIGLQKWKSWSNVASLSSVEAKTQYIDLVQRLTQ